MHAARHRGADAGHALWWGAGGTAGLPSIRLTVTPIDTNSERVIVEDSVTIADQAIRFGRVRVTAP